MLTSLFKTDSDPAPDDDTIRRHERPTAPKRTLVSRFRSGRTYIQLLVSLFLHNF